MCVDTNECLQDNVCGRGQCVNVDGGFECQCADGYAAGVDGTCEGMPLSLSATSQSSFMFVGQVSKVIKEVLNIFTL